MLLAVKFAIERYLYQNTWLRHYVRQALPYLTWALPHNKSFYGFKHFLKRQDGLFLDVGANDGISALGFAQICRHYRIFSIEANPLQEKKLKRVKRRLKNFDFLLVAAGSREAQLTLRIPQFKQYTMDTAASLHPEYIQEVMTKEFSAEDYAAIAFKEISVAVIPLDKLNLNPDIIKIDTEGADVEVLRGLRETIARCRPVITFEYSSPIKDGARELMNQQHYSLYDYTLSQDAFRPLNDTNNLLNEFKNPQNLFLIPNEKTAHLPLQT